MSVFDEGLSSDQKIMKWNETQAQMKKLVDLERRMRAEVIETCFADPKKGTNTLELGGGWKLKAILGTEDKLDVNLYELISTKLSAETIASCVKFTPSLIAAGYKSLNEAEKTILNEAVVTKPKSPSLELVAPKEQ